MKLFPLYLLAVLIGACFLIAEGQMSATDNCTNLAESADCSFYTECVERNTSCGPSGYALGYGYPFCTALEKFSRAFTAEGQAWIQNVRRCLINATFIQYQSGANCEQLRDSAFDSHLDCYVSNGFCSDILFNTTNLRGLYTALSTRIRPPFRTWSLKQVIFAALRCISSGTDAILDFLQSAIEETSDKLFIRFLEDMRDSFSINWTRDFCIIFVVDSSESIGPDNFEIMKDFVADVILELNATSGSKIGVIRFSDNAELVIPLASVGNLSNLTAQVQAINYTGGSRATDTALDLMIRELEADSANNATLIGILLTAGQSNNSPQTLEAAARVRAAGISMYTVGIDIDITTQEFEELRVIASSPFYAYSFFIRSFIRIEFDRCVLLLVRQICSTPESGLLATKSTLRLVQREYTHITYQYDTEGGISLRFQVQESTSVRIFLSFSVRNPTQSTADIVFTVTLYPTHYFVSPELYYTATGMQSNGMSVMPWNATTPNATLFVTVCGLNEINVFTIRTVQGDGALRDCYLPW